MENTFEADFLQSQPELNFADFLDKKKRKQFQESFKIAFERYINDRLASWEFIAKQKLTKAFTYLNEQSQEYQVSYKQVVAVMNQKLLGSRFYNTKTQNVAAWADSVSDIFFVIPDNLNGAVGSFNSFWQTILASICVGIAMRIVGLLFTGIALNIFGAILLGLGTVAIQAEYVRREFLNTTKKEFAKYLPKIVEEQQQSLSSAIEKCFDTYKQQAIAKINHDLESRKTELTNLLEQKENYQINHQHEVERLENLQASIDLQIQFIETLF